MLFLGTKKYPDEDEYESFLNQYGGQSNAYTDMEDTNYFFSVTTEANANGQTTSALEGALDRLAQFFIAPTFDRDAVDREINAIDSEYRNGFTSDSWRNYQLLKSSCDPEHPFAKFGCGNKETLLSKGLDHLLSELHNFWKNHYQTYNLRLAVVGHAGLDQLQRTVEQTFGQLSSSQGLPRRRKVRENQVFVREHAVYNIPAFGPDQLGWIRNVVPLTEMRNIKVMFATPPLDDPAVYLSKPYRALSHILGHEAPGSLHALLNEHGYITGLSSGAGIDASDFSLFNLSLSLTPKGMKEKDRVLDLIFQWIALLRANKDNLAGYHEELRQIAAMNFRFRENGDPTDFCSTAAELLFLDDGTDPARILFSQSESSGYDPLLAEAFLDRMRPRNCIITIHNSDLDSSVGTWETEKWYGAKYQIEPITEEQIRTWESSPLDREERLALPSLNKYIPSDFSLRCDDTPDHFPVTDAEIDVPPILLINTPKLRMWHKMDKYWRVPKAFVRLALLSSTIYSSPTTMTQSRIFQRVLNDDLNSFVYDASVAGCNYRVTATPYGYRISVRGYSEKLPFLLDTLTTRILSLIQDMKDGKPSLREKFDTAKEGLLRETKNYRLDSPNEVANYNSRLLIEENVWYLDNYIDLMEGEEADKYPLTMVECGEVAEECFTGRLQCEALCIGNIDIAGTNEVSNVIDRHFLGPGRALSEAETPTFRSMKLPTKDEAIRIFGGNVADRSIPLIYQDVAYSDSEENSAVEIVLQAGCELELGYEGIAILDLITHIAYNSAYNQLRTKEQLGYLVSSFARKTAGQAWGMSIVVQSSVVLPDVLEERVEAWLKVFRSELERMSPESVAQEASAVVAQLLEKDTKMSQEVGRVFGEILNTQGLTTRIRQPAFDRLDRLASQLSVKDENTPSDGALKTAQQLKDQLLTFFDERLAANAPQRRVMSTRVYNQKDKHEFDAHVGKPGILSSHADMRHLKQFLSSYPSIPYWRIDNADVPQLT
jgi:insulysin